MQDGESGAGGSPPGPASGVAATSPPRIAALSFTEGVRSGWQAMELLGWCREHLLGRGFLRLRDPLSGRFTVHEPDAGGIELSTSLASPSPRRSDTADFARATRIVEIARTRTLEALNGLLAAPPDDRFLSAAIQGGRVQRVRDPGARSARWLPSLDEGTALTQIVLTLFAADALMFREEYDRALRICRTCGSVAFDGDLGGRFRCAEHSDRPSSRLGDVPRTASDRTAAPSDPPRKRSEPPARAETQPSLPASNRPPSDPQQASPAAKTKPPSVTDSGRRFSPSAPTSPGFSAVVPPGTRRG
jgi:hypothetical protein